MLSFGLMSFIPLIGLALIAVPVWLHLRKSRQIRSISIGSIHLLKLLQQKPSKKKSLENILLLIIRGLIVFLAVMLLAFPFINYETSISGNVKIIHKQLFEQLGLEHQQSPIANTKSGEFYIFDNQFIQVNSIDELNQTNFEINWNQNYNYSVSAFAQLSSQKFPDKNVILLVGDKLAKATVHPDLWPRNVLIQTIKTQNKADKTVELNLYGDPKQPLFQITLASLNALSEKIKESFGWQLASDQTSLLIHPSQMNQLPEGFVLVTQASDDKMVKASLIQLQASHSSKNLESIQQCQQLIKANLCLDIVFDPFDVQNLQVPTIALQLVDYFNTHNATSIESLFIESVENESLGESNSNMVHLDLIHTVMLLLMLLILLERLMIIKPLGIWSEQQ